MAGPLFPSPLCSRPFAVHSSELSHSRPQAVIGVERRLEGRRQAASCPIRIRCNGWPCDEHAVSLPDKLPCASVFMALTDM